MDTTDTTVTLDARSSLGRLPGGLYVLAVRRGGETNGMPVSWVTPVSGDPPLVVVAVRPDRRTHAMLAEGDRFALSLLSEGQADLVARFKVKGEPASAKFEGVDTTVGARSGAPLIGGAAVHLECRVVSTASPGDHTLFFAVVEGATISKDPPLTTIGYGKGYTG